MSRHVLLNGETNDIFEKHVRRIYSRTNEMIITNLSRAPWSAQLRERGLANMGVDAS